MKLSFVRFPGLETFEHTSVVRTSLGVNAVDLDTQRNPTALPFPFRCDCKDVGSAGQLRVGREFAPRTGLGPLSRSLSLNLEVGKNDGRIHGLAGVRPDTDVSFTYLDRRGGLPEALSRLDDLAAGADFVLGHNLIDFDLPYLRAANPNLRFLQLPAVDTLRLNPLALPHNPYHYLVMHYQAGSLRRRRTNDPEPDARVPRQ